jgi:hypothetical protein
LRSFVGDSKLITELPTATPDTLSYVYRQTPRELSPDFRSCQDVNGQLSIGNQLVKWAILTIGQRKMCQFANRANWQMGHNRANHYKDPWHNDLFAAVAQKRLSLSVIGLSHQLEDASHSMRGCFLVEQKS